MKDLMPRDIIAIILIIGGLILIYCGLDGLVGTILTMVAAFYFGSELLRERPRDESY